MYILLINHYAGSPELGMVYRHYYLAKEWVKMGHRVLIVGGSFSHLRRQQPTSTREMIDGIEFCWIPVSQYKGSGLGRIKSMFDFVSKLWFNYKNLLKDFSPDVVIASSTYNFEIFPAKRIAEKYKAKLVYEVRDIWPLTPMELGGYSKHHPFIMAMQAAEDYCYRHAYKVVSLLPNALEHMVERGMNPDKFAYVPNGFDPAEWNINNALPDEHHTTIKRLRDEGKFVLLYAGGHAISNSLDTLLDAAKLIENKRVAIVLVGKGNEKVRLMKRVDDEKIENVIFLPPVEKECVPTLLSEADALYIGWGASPLYRFGICPNKLVDYMVSGKPIIHSVTAANDAVKDAGCGISVPAGDAEGVARAIDSLCEYPASRLDSMGKRGREYALSHWDYGKLSDDFISTPPII